MRATLSAGVAPPSVQDRLYRTWAYWNWPTVRCPGAPFLDSGHWQVRTVDPDGIQGPILVLAQDLSVAELLHPEEGALVLDMLGRIARVDRRVSFGRGTVQLLRMTDGSCALAGHVFNAPGYYLPPSVLQAIAPYILRWGAVPYLERPTSGSTGRFAVAFVGLATSDGQVRRAQYPTLTVRYNSSAGTAQLI